MTTAYFQNLTTLEQIRDRYQQAASEVKATVSDRKERIAIAKEINAQYHIALTAIGCSLDDVDRLNILESLKKASVEGETSVVGTWIWVKAPISEKSKIEACGLKWSSKNKAFYWNPGLLIPGMVSTKDMKGIEKKYGKKSY